jgi:Ner family transcriptional regulator
MRTELTNEEKQRLGLANESQREVIERGWTREQIKALINQKGFTISGLERALSLPPGTLNRSLVRRSPKADNLLAKFLDVHVSTLWPNRYLRNGNPIHFHYRAECMSDEELEKLNAATEGPREQIVVSLPGGMNLT